MSISTSPSPVAAPELTDQREEVELLPSVNDHYGGVMVEMKTPMDSSAFVSSLRASISYWRKQGIKGVWIKLPINLSNLVQPAVEEGFWYHHAEPSYLMLVYWIPDTKHTIPANASHRVGVGGFVMNDKREVLVVQENSGKLHGSGVWKIPTGVVDQGEDIYAAAVREVKEETGIDTEFVEILAFRQNHMSFFGKSDLFFVCMLRPLSFDIQKQESEIEAAQWMPIEEYAAQPFVQKYDVLKYITDVSLAKAERGYAGFSPVCVKSPFSHAQDYLYLNRKDLSQPSRPGNMSESNWDL
ncbi:nudix hydrolase 2 isoform X1 [Elaeis guineensis]|uniref:Nudix hydrolase 2 isoform X1 n=2 Tax=Elaeis guineensis var. tenera TaxID=51953 RepID=A0A6I9SEB3_ELAGV|nr:nudix hydrolase 2 isoform X1 [Elaeis guineensis]XP_010942277.1 nudix hydrolase 2 isoform X1 [Elaeis guineensis]